MTSFKKVIDIAIPVLDEERFLKESISSVLKFSIPRNITIMIYIIDGGSKDQTLNIAKSFSEEYANIVVLHNEKKIASSALNIAINIGEGDYLMRLDAHSIYPKNYLEECYKTLERTNATNVGGLAITEPGNDSYSAALVQSLTTHWFGVGDSGFRTNAKEGPSDTVPYGFFDKRIFKKIGLYDERLVRAQDYEMNNRIIKNNGLIWLNPKIFFYYKNQSSLYNFYKKQILKEAPYNAYMWWVSPSTFTVRHAITGVFSIGLLGGIFLSPLSNIILLTFLSIMSLYIFLAFFASFRQSIRYGYYSHVLLLPICFFLYHFLHGIGLLYGCLMLLIKNAPIQKSTSEM